MRTILTTALLMTAFSAFAKDVEVNGYVKRDGTYVQPYTRSEANDTKADNWTTKGNTNPYTGSEGTKTYEDYSNSNRKGGE